MATFGIARRERRLGGSARPIPIVTVTAASAADQHFLLRLARRAQYARTWHQGVLTTHIFNLAAAQRFLTENASDLAVVTFRADKLFPLGTLRQMEGDAHKQYRRLFAAGLREISVAANLPTIEAICRRVARRLAAMGSARMGDLGPLLKDVTRELMLKLLLGIDADDPCSDLLIAIYRPMSVDRLGETFTAASFSALRVLLEPIAREERTGLLQFFARSGTLDETMLGNIAMMVEVGSYDLMGLWCWLLKLLGDNSGVQQALRAGAHQDRLDYSEAAILEALRLERFEYLARSTRRDIVFDGVVIPAKTLVKVAAWEAHKDPLHFPDPFRFEPMRFVAGRPPNDHYSTLGIGHHRCLGADWTIGTGAAFIREMTSAARLEILEDGSPRKKAYHFAPSDRLRLAFHPLTGEAG